MDLDEKTIKEIAAQLGIDGGANISREEIRRLEQKSDAQLMAEIQNLKQQLKGENVSYSQQAELLRQLMPLMDDKQKARLQSVIELLR